jgi:hypothetical protein
MIGKPFSLVGSEPCAPGDPRPACKAWVIRHQGERAAEPVAKSGRAAAKNAVAPGHSYPGPKAAFGNLGKAFVAPAKRHYGPLRATTTGGGQASVARQVDRALAKLPPDMRAMLTDVQQIQVIGNDDKPWKFLGLNKEMADAMAEVEAADKKDGFETLAVHWGMTGKTVVFNRAARDPRISLDMTVTHEMGHALDNLNNLVSDHNKEFKDRLDIDKFHYQEAVDEGRINELQKKNIGEFLFERGSGRQEAFAQIFALTLKKQRGETLTRQESLEAAIFGRSMEWMDRWIRSGKWKSKGH